MFLITIIVAALVGFAGGFMTASVFLFGDVDEEDNYVPYYDAEEFR